MRVPRSDADLDPRSGTVIGGLAALGLAVALVPLREDLTPATLALLLVLPVLLGAMTGGRLGGAITAVVATLGFDFFLTRPYLSLHIDSADDVETAGLLLVVGLIVGTVAAGGHRAVMRAREGRSEIDAIYRVAELVASGAAEHTIIESARLELIGVLRLVGCDYDESTASSSLPRLERTGTFRGAGFTYVPGGFVLPSGIDLEVVSGGVARGRFVLHGSADKPVSIAARLAAVVIADHVGAALAVSGGSREERT